MSSPRESAEDTNRDDELTENPSTVAAKEEGVPEGEDAGSRDGGEAEKPSSGSVDVLQLQDDTRSSPAAIETKEEGFPIHKLETSAESEESATSEAVHSPDPMESSVATLKAETPSVETPSLKEPQIENATSSHHRQSAPSASQPTSRSSSRDPKLQNYALMPEPPSSPTRSDAGFDEKQNTSEDERDGGANSEIQSIMDQFSEEGQGPGHEEVMSPRLEIAGPLLGHPIQHPPRKSSLEPLSPSVAQSLQEFRLTSNDATRNDAGPAVPPKPGSIHSLSSPRAAEERYTNMDSAINPSSPPLHRPPPPEPEPEPALPFDFHRFLEQLRHKTADPVAKFLRSFLQEFGKKQWMVHEQVKIISDFLAFISNKMAQCEVWRDVSDAEFDNAREGMEKLVMNRLYTQTFSPAIPAPQPLPGSKPRRRGAERPMGPGRRGQHQEDVERDEVLAQKISIYSWVKEEHLDIAPVGESGRRFLVLAQQGKSHWHL